MYCITSKDLEYSICVIWTPFDTFYVLLHLFLRLKDLVPAHCMEKSDQYSHQAFFLFCSVKESHAGLE